MLVLAIEFSRSCASHDRPRSRRDELEDVDALPIDPEGDLGERARSLKTEQRRTGRPALATVRLESLRTVDVAGRSSSE
jgi:hypothetical protein